MNFLKKGNEPAEAERKDRRLEIQPASYVAETETGYLVTLEMPGIDPAKIELSIQGRTLTVSGENEVPFFKELRPTVREIPPARFAASFDLPDNVDGDKIAASSKNGLLCLTLPKREAVKPRKIAIAG